MILTQEEQQILSGDHGLTLQKIMKTLVSYGEAMGAERLVEIEGGGHFALHHTLSGIGPRLEMLDELVKAGVKTRHPFTVDPVPPLEFDNLQVSIEQQQEFIEMFRFQAHFHRQMLNLGMRKQDAYSCTPYLPEMQNVPHKGEILAWSESSAVVFVNSVIGARTNRNAVIFDLLSNILGKTPLMDLLTDAGRRAKWLIEVETSRLPDPQILGGAIGKKVMEDVPYLSGLERFFTSLDDTVTRDYLKEMGAACAAIGAVGLYHVENITPEAIEQGRELLVSDFQIYKINDETLENLYSSYPVLWTHQDVSPQRCLIGCPHVSLQELYSWTEKIVNALKLYGCNQVAIPTLIVASPPALRQFQNDRQAYQKLLKTGVRVSVVCLEAFMKNSLLSNEAVITNSNKLRAFTSARLFQDQELLKVIATGKL